MFALERRIAIEAVLKASKLCQTTFNKLVQNQTLTKSDLSPVTVADFGCQAIVNEILSQHFPQDPIVGEEDAKDLRENPVLGDQVVELVNSLSQESRSAEQIYASIDLGRYEGGRTGRFWTLDPIDGTKGFLRGEQFAVCLALVEDGIVKVGVLGCPNLPHDLTKNGDRGSVYVAVKDQGAFMRTFEDNKETQIHVCSVSDSKDTQFCESVESGHSAHDKQAQIAKDLNITKPSIRMDSQCKYAVVARGDAGIYLRLPTRKDYEEKIWDHAAGSLIITEAGGKITDIYGKELDFAVGRTLKNNKGIIATNGKIHEQVLKAVSVTVSSL
ncbi:hypothetical protein EDD86DRAFT_204953 [Gorgonomyces haynaldii]|nr:hypothetical protein EDD86DRAFT_204953 [Gorgonomyces haynaldii]